MKNLFKIYLFLILAFNSFLLMSQESVPDENKIQLIARVQSKKIALRWAVTTPTAWIRANKYGYVIERFTIKRNDQRLETPIKKQLTFSPLKPKPLDEWKNAVENNDYAAIFAQALYGESFQVGDMQGGLAQIVNKAKELDQRFSFALFAADMNFESALLGGLAFIDNTVQENETYFYKITTAIPEELLKVEEGSVLVDASKIEVLPQPIDLIAVGDEKSILMTWEYEMFKSIFTTYYMERSQDGTNFKRLGDTPIVNLNSKPGNEAKRMIYVDTLSQNNKTYHYRVIGISPFGEESPPSEIVSAQGIKKLTTVPHISRHDYNKDGSVLLTWTFLKETEPEITGFELNWAANDAGPYKVVKTDILPTTRKTTFQKPEESNYFTITAVGKNNQKTTSFSAFVQIADSIPPAMPTGLTGTVDSLGVVNIKWNENVEGDMLGYRVFRGNLKNEEVSQLTVDPIERTTFIDTVQIKSLNANVFYQIVAVDKRFNMSDYSEVLTLKKPDVVPPSSPLFSTYKVNQEGVFLDWINSSSDDLKLHKLFRKKIENEKNEWQLIFETDTISQFTDTKVITGNKYRYAIFAEDESGLISLPSTPITLTVQINTPVQVVKNFTGIADRVAYQIDLSWRIVDDNVTEILIYKNQEGNKPILWKQLSAKAKNITDKSVSPSTNYTYQLKAILKNSGYSKIETVNVTY